MMDDYATLRIYGDFLLRPVEFMLLPDSPYGIIFLMVLLLKRRHTFLLRTLIWIGIIRANCGVSCGMVSVVGVFNVMRNVGGVACLK